MLFILKKQRRIGHGSREVVKRPNGGFKGDGSKQSHDSASSDIKTTNFSRSHSRTSKTNRTSFHLISLTSQEINRIKAKAKLQKWEIDQMAKKHDAEQIKKNKEGQVQVARKFMNYVEFGKDPDRVTNERFLQDEGFKRWIHGRRRSSTKRRV